MLVALITKNSLSFYLNLNPFTECTFLMKTMEYSEKKHGNQGRQKSQDAIGCLGLVLFWYRIKRSSAQIFPWFLALQTVF